MYTDLTNFQSGLKKAGNDLNGFNNSLKNIGGMIAGVFSTAAIIQFGKETVQLAASAEAVETAFKRINGAAYLNDIQQATRGTVSDLELMKQVIRANNFDIPLQQLATLFEFARRRAEETGQSVDYLVESIVLGIGRKSPLILDNLGISAVRLRQELKGVSAEVATVGDVARVVGNIASEELAKMGAEAVTNQQALSSMVAEWDNQKLAIGKTILESKSFRSELGAIKTVIEDIKGRGAVTDAQGTLMQGLFKYDTKSTEGVKKAVAEIEALMAGLNSHYDTAFERFFKAGDATKAKDLNDQLGVLFQQLKNIQLVLIDQEKYNVPSFNYEGLVKTKDDLPKITGIIGILNKKLSEHKDLMEKATSEKTIIFHQREIQLLEMKLQRIELLNVAMSKMTRIQTKPQVGYQKFVTPNGIVGGEPTAGLANNGQLRTGHNTVNIGDGGDSIQELQGYAQEANAIFQQFKVDIAANVAEGIGALISGDMGITDFFDMILNSVLEFAKAFGRQLVALGVAKTALDKLFLIPGAGAVAIVAGMALMTMASVMQASFSKGPSMPALATGTNYIPNDGAYYLHQGEAVVPKKFNEGGMMPQTITVRGVISGRDINLVSERYSYSTSRM
jgi:hypothetical protein